MVCTGCEPHVLQLVVYNFAVLQGNTGISDALRHSTITIGS